jgi:hypothetical protein
LAGGLEVRVRIFIIALLWLFSVGGCSNTDDCFLAESFKEIPAPTLNEKGLYIILRSSGFNEKEHFYEMFKGIPTFDECGQTQQKTISQVHVDTSIGRPVKLIVRNNRLEIVYASADSKYQLDTISIDVE